LSAPVKIAIAGLGTVGAAVFRLVTEKSALLGQRAGRQIEVSAVSARDRGRDRGISLENVRWFDDAADMAQNANADIIVELIGGSDGIALEVCEAAIASGKDVVTANKALLAHHGAALAVTADQAGRSIAYEAAVAGGIPVIKALREGLAANRVDSIYGILNGTCNFILTAMRDSGCDFETVLKEAQEKGYAEADPGFDVDGVDAAHKLSILTAVAFGCAPDFDAVSVEGIRHISDLDIAFADELGYRIKLLGIARRTGEGIEQSVHPCMVRTGSPMAHVDGVFNAVAIQGDDSGPVVLEGQGAGAGPTASAVVADIMDLAKGLRLPVFGIPANALSVSMPANTDRQTGRYYVRLMVVDRPGVFADVAAALRDENVSMEAILQRTRAPGEPVPVVMTTHEVAQSAVRKTVKRFAALDTVVEEPRIIGIEPLTF